MNKRQEFLKYYDSLPFFFVVAAIISGIWVVLTSTTSSIVWFVLISFAFLICYLIRLTLLKRLESKEEEPMNELRWDKHVEHILVCKICDFRTSYAKVMKEHIEKKHSEIL